MSKTRKCSFKFLRTWPRTVFEQKNGNKLVIKSEKTLSKPGVYILYCGTQPYYVGKADCLFDRLHTHANKMTDRYYAFWDHFSAFAFNSSSAASKERIGELEGILIAAIPNVVNSSTPRWPKHKIPHEIRMSIKGGQKPKAMAAGAGR
jgi:predicted GIY-YIG superfamily endonuclease